MHLKNCTFIKKFVCIVDWSKRSNPHNLYHTLLEELETYFLNNKDLQIISMRIDRYCGKWKYHTLDKSINFLK